MYPFNILITDVQLRFWFCSFSTSRTCVSLLISPTIRPHLRAQAVLCQKTTLGFGNRMLKDVYVVELVCLFYQTQ